MLPALTLVSIVGSRDCGQAVWTTVRGRPGLAAGCAIERPATSAPPAPTAAKRRNSRRLVLWRSMCSPSRGSAIVVTENEERRQAGQSIYVGRRLSTMGPWFQDSPITRSGRLHLLDRRRRSPCPSADPPPPDRLD